MSQASFKQHLLTVDVLLSLSLNVQIQRSLPEGEEVKNMKPFFCISLKKKFM